MLSGTPLREPWTQDKLVEELKQRRGNQFDPQVIELALKLIETQEIELRITTKEQ
jgi:response regulator RpfG family c-di-GMP phosphodiesterase